MRPHRAPARVLASLIELLTLPPSLNIIAHSRKNKTNWLTKRAVVSPSKLASS